MPYFDYTTNRIFNQKQTLSFAMYSLILLSHSLTRLYPIFNYQMNILSPNGKKPNMGEIRILNLGNKKERLMRSHSTS